MIPTENKNGRFRGPAGPPGNGRPVPGTGLRPAGWRGPDWAWVLGAAALVRLVAWAGYTMIGADSMHFLGMAARIESGDVDLAWAHPLRYHPGYPSLITAVHFLLAPFGAGLEASALALTVVAGVLMVLPVYGLARWAFGADAGLVAGLLAAFHPELVLLSADVMTETSFFCLQGASIAFLARGLVTRQALAWAGAGLGAAGALWIRAEGIYSALLVAAGGIWAVIRERSSGRRAVGDAAVRAALALSVLVVAFAPYLLWIHRTTGQWSFTNKGSARVAMSSLTGSTANRHERPVSPYLLQKAFGRSAAYWSLVPLIGLGIAATVRRRAWSPPAVVALALGGIGCAGQIAGHVLIHYAVSTRYFLQGMVFVVPVAGYGLVTLGEWAACRGRTTLGRVAVAAVIVPLALVSTWKSVAPARSERLGLREAGEWILGEFGPGRILFSCEEQPAYYAQTLPISVPRSYDEAERRMTASPGSLLVLMEKNFEDLEPGFSGRLAVGPIERVAEFPALPRAGREPVRVYRLRER